MALLMANKQKNGQPLPPKEKEPAVEIKVAGQEPMWKRILTPKNVMSAVFGVGALLAYKQDPEEYNKFAAEQVKAFPKMVAAGVVAEAARQTAGQICQHM